MSPDFIKRKILLLGDASVGKTSLIRRFVVDKFSDDYITTIGTKVTKKDLRLESPGKVTDLTFMIWDVLGQKRSEEHTSELQSHHDLVCRLLLEKKKQNKIH